MELKNRYELILSIILWCLLAGFIVGMIGCISDIVKLRKQYMPQKEVMVHRFYYE